MIMILSQRGMTTNNITHANDETRLLLSVYIVSNHTRNYRFR